MLCWLLFASLFVPIIEWASSERLFLAFKDELLFSRWFERSVCFSPFVSFLAMVNKG